MLVCLTFLHIFHRHQSSPGFVELFIAFCFRFKFVWKILAMEITAKWKILENFTLNVWFKFFSNLCFIQHNNFRKLKVFVFFSFNFHMRQKMLSCFSENIFPMYDNLSSKFQRVSRRYWSHWLEHWLVLMPFLFELPKIYF